MKINLQAIVKTEGTKIPVVLAIVSESVTLVEIQETGKLEDLKLHQLRYLKENGKVSFGSTGWNETVQLMDFEADISEEVAKEIYERWNAESR